MNKKFKTRFFATLMCFGIITAVSAQQQSIPNLVSARIADKLKDTLDLRAIQRDSIYFVNVELNRLKDDARRQHRYADGQLQNVIQRIENTRDSLYESILGVEKYKLYRQKKRYLVNAN